MIEANDAAPTQDIPLTQSPPEALEYQRDQHTLFAAQLASLLLRIMAIYLFVISMPIIGMLIPITRMNFGSGSAGWFEFFARSMVYIVYLTIAVVLFWGAPMWGAKLVRGAVGFEGPPINTANVQAVAI